MIESRRDSRGFTLPEVLIVVVLMGVLMSAVAAVFSVIVRTSPTSESRVDDAVSLLGLTTWLPPDVNSTPSVAVASAAANWNTADTAASGCSSGDVGTNLVVLNWSEQTGSTPTTYTASYRLLDDGAGGSTMMRISCTDGGAGNVRELVRELPAMSSNPVGVTIRNDGTTVVGLSMTVSTVNGDTLRFDAQSNNPDEVLAAIPTPGTIAATTTTSTTTTTVAPATTVAPTTSVGETTTTTTATTTIPATTTTTTIPCTANFVSSNAISPSKVRNQKGKPQTFGPLEENVYVTITKSGSCAGLRLEFVRAPGGDAAERQPVRLSFGDGVEAILSGSEPTERWEDGNRSLRLYDTASETYVGGIRNLEVQ